MADRRTVRGSGGIAALLAPQIKLGGMVLLAAAPILAVAAVVPRATVLPTVSLVAIVVGAIAAIAAWQFRVRHHSNTVNLWDIAGAFVLIGCAAAMLSEPENILQAFGQPKNP